MLVSLVHLGFVEKDTRDYDSWFDLDHIIDSQCEIEDHEVNVNKFDFEDLELYEKALIEDNDAIVNGKIMCRYCFLSGADM